MSLSAPTDAPEIVQARVRERSGVRHVALMSAARLIGHLTSMASGFVNAYVLGPAGLGVYKTLNVIASYAGYNDFGMMKGMYRDLPIAIGRGDSGARARIQNTAATNATFTTAVAILVLWALYLAGIRFKGVLTPLTLGLLSGVILLETGVQYLDFYAKASGYFDAVAKRDLAMGFLSPAVGIPLVILWKVPGVLGGIIVVYVVQIALMQLWLRLRIRLRWDPVQTVALVRTGLLMMANAFAGQIYWTVDLTIAATMLPIRDVGFYGFALGALNLAEIFPSTINRLAWQRMGTVRGRSGGEDPAVFRAYLGNPWIIYLLAGTISAGAVTFVYGVGIRALLPAYTAAIPILWVMAYGYMFYTARGFSTTFLNLSDQMGRLGAIQLLAIGVNVGLDIALIPHLGIMGAAVGSSVSYFLFTHIIVFVVMQQVFGTVSAPIAFLGKLTLSLSLAAAAMVLIGQVGTTLYARDGGHLFRAAVGCAVGLAQIGVYSAVCTVIFLTVFRRRGLRGDLAAMARDLRGIVTRGPVSAEAVA